MSRVAIIGGQGRFPGGASEPEAFFQQLMAGTCWAGPVPPERWSAARFQATEKAAGKMAVEGGYFLDADYQGFEPDVFGLAPEETACLDPQQRLLLEVAWEALELAALDPAALAGQPVGVYVGGFTTDHLLNQFAAPARGVLGRFSAVGSTLTMLANRLSHVFDLRGPSLTVDTACASSLSALALAVRDLEAGACSLALVGGASVMLRPEYPLAMAAAGLLARDGRCKPFSVRADGYGRGEGAAVLVLKPVAQANADGDRVWAVIEGVGQGHGGRTAGIALPHGAAQQAVMARVLAATGLDPDDIGYVEAHGTGTERGDAVEAAAIGAVYGRGRASALPIGSVKANIGHLEAAAGVAGVIKALGILQARCLPPHRLEGAPSPAIPFAALGLRLARAGEPLGASRVAVNAFGYGGSLVHVILGPGPPDSGTAAGAAPLGEVLAGEVLVPLGAPSAPALAEGCERLAQRVEAGGVTAADLTHTLGRRGGRAWRAALWVPRAADPATLAAALRGGARTGGRRAEVGRHDAPVLFVFSGMGPQWPGMGRGLAASEPVFRQTLEEIDALWAPLAGFSLSAVLLADEVPEAPWPCRLAQPAGFALQCALVRVLARHGLRPDGCLGHSAGEVAAAFCAGHLSLEDAVRVCWARSRLQNQRAGRGGLLAVRLPQAAVAALQEQVPGLALAALNGPTALTLAGSDAVLAEAQALLRRQGVPWRRLPGEIAYHSADMDPLEAPLRAALAGLAPREPSLLLFSSVTARRVSAEAGMDAAYWWDNVRQPVRFHEALAAAFALGVRHCLEIGARPVLQGPLREAARVQTHPIVVQPVLDGRPDEAAALRHALARHYESGGELDWRAQAPEGRLVGLPVTAWQRRPFWHEAEVQALDRRGDPAASPWAEPAAQPRTWRADLNRPLFAFLADHRIEGVPVLPGAAALEAALQAGRAAGAFAADTPLCLEACRFPGLFPLTRRHEQVLDSRVVAEALEVLAYDPARPAHVTRVLTARIGEAAPRPAACAVGDLAARAPHPVDLEVQRARLGHGPAFQGPSFLSLAADGGAALARISLHRPSCPVPEVQGVPALLDGVFQAALALRVGEGAVVLTAVQRLSMYAPLPATVWAWVTLASDDPTLGVCDAWVLDDAGICLARLDGVTARPLRRLTPPVPRPDFFRAPGWEVVPVQSGEADCGARPVRVVAPAGPQAERLKNALGAVAPAVEVTLLPVAPLAEGLATLLALGIEPGRGRLCFLTHDAQPVMPQDQVRPDQAAVWGLGRALRNDIGDVSLIDVASADPWAEGPALERLWHEIGGGAPAIALRGGQRYRPCFVPVAEVEDAPWRGDPGRSYLVTGGLGGFGQVLALWLVRHGAGRVVLTSRSVPSQARVAPLARAVGCLGGEMAVRTLDVTDPQAVRTLMRELARTDRPLAGVFHWAGQTRDRPARDLTDADVRAVLAPKVEGALALHQASLDLRVETFVMASSLSALLGTPRQAAYAAANAFLDGLAWARHRAGLPALSVNFGPIAGVGMAASAPVAAFLSAAGLPLLDPAVALAGLGAALGAGRPQICLARAFDTARWECRGLGPRPGGERESDGERGRRLALQYRDLLAGIIKTSPDYLPLDTPLDRLGLDSLAAVEFQAAVERDLGHVMPLAALLGRQTLLDLAAAMVCADPS